MGVKFIALRFIHPLVQHVFSLIQIENLFGISNNSEIHKNSMYTIHTNQNDQIQNTMQPNQNPETN